VRAQWYEIDQNTTSFNETTCNRVTGTFPTCYAPLSSNTEFVTPSVSVIFEPSMSQTYYVSYSTSATPPGITVSNGSTIGAPGGSNSVGTSDLDPEENESIEAGAKFELFGDRLLVQTSVFQVKKENAKEEDPQSLNIVRSGDSQEITGFEIGAAGAITDQWSVNANYTYLDTETTDCSPPNGSPPGTPCANIGKRTAFTPEHAASLWTTYNFLGALAGLEVGLGVTYQGDVALNVANSGFAPEYTSLDALISYGWDRYRLSLNAYNLTDELYYSQVHGNRVVPAAGRNFIATLGVVF
jgi:catecholate siderophore receptor